ncbi:hypothetical protein BD289DRAFT_472693 [Coniella lustricola]|uniref:BZIP domain-containing protein n=1 Tax=Coniella lustricola TaxID=2025994 RepID=A0A2T3AED6_9PEZI|nr:hypothetical protein BD289DRAFT_472693 [Coniella lustricola]
MDHQSSLLTPSPQVKSEDYLGDDSMLPPLFGSEFAPDHIDPSDLLSPSGSQMQAMSPSEFGSPAPESTPEASDKKPTKKRKSWGQVLPEPKTNLPPRKRAKTEDEKEQRRVERVLRNRRAAQSSRERKRQETEALATRNQELENALIALTQKFNALEKELRRVKPELGGISTSSDSQLTFSQPLFACPSAAPQVAEAENASQETMSQPTLDLINSLVRQQQADGETPKTVDPTCISPALTPIAEEPSEEPVTVTLDSSLLQQPAPVTEAVADSTTRLTQYSAAVLCDLQCQRLVETTTPSFSAVSELQTMALHFSRTFFTFMLLAMYHLQKQTQLISIIKLVTNTTSTSLLRGTTTCPTLPTPTTTTNSCKPLRLRLLRQLLTSNRQLARPLLDATLEVLRLKQCRNGDMAGMQFLGCLSIAEDLPSVDRLMALAVSLRIMEQRIESKFERNGVFAIDEALSGLQRSGVQWRPHVDYEDLSE